MYVSPPGVTFYWLGMWVLVTPIDPPRVMTGDMISRYTGEDFWLSQDALLRMVRQLNVVDSDVQPGTYVQQQVRTPEGDHVTLDKWRRQQRRWRLSFWRGLGEAILEGIGEGLFRLADMLGNAYDNVLYKWDMWRLGRRRR